MYRQQHRGYHLDHEVQKLLIALTAASLIVYETLGESLIMGCDEDSSDLLTSPVELS